MNVPLSYEDFKDLAASKNLLWQYATDAKKYDIFATDGQITYETLVWIDCAHILGIDAVAEAARKLDFETNYKPNANRVSSMVGGTYNATAPTLTDGKQASLQLDNHGKLYVRDEQLEDVILALGGQVTTGDPVQFSDIAPGGHRPKKKELIDTSAEALLIDAEVPVGKKWYITAWDGSSQGKGFYTIVDWTDASAVYTTIDVMDATTGWIIDEKITSITLDTVEKHEGTGSVKVLTLSNKDGANSRFSKTFTLDLSASQEVSIWVKAPASGKTLALKLYSSGKTFTFPGQIMTAGWVQHSFPLKDVINVVLSAVIKIEFIINANGIKGREAENYNFDSLQHFTGANEIIIDHFFSAAYTPHQHLFPTAVPVVAGHHVRVYAQNDDSSSKYYEVGFNGREVSV
jgi:hypothetical protein